MSLMPTLEWWAAAPKCVLALAYAVLAAAERLRALYARSARRAARKVCEAARRLLVRASSVPDVPGLLVVWVALTTPTAGSGSGFFEMLGRGFSASSVGVVTIDGGGGALGALEAALEAVF